MFRIRSRCCADDRCVHKNGASASLPRRPEIDPFPAPTGWAMRSAFEPHMRTCCTGEEMMETSVRKLFERYESVFKRSLGGDIDRDEIAALYSSEFIAASPAGVMTGKNDDQLKQVMAQGYAHYRAIGTKGMRIRDVRFSALDEHHCVAHVAWTATYSRMNQPEVEIDFDVTYFIDHLVCESQV